MMTKQASRVRQFTARGFTLIELVISIAVGSIISGSAAMLLWNATSQRSDAAARGELFDLASTSMEVLVRHLREIPQDECPSGSTPCLNENAQVGYASATEIRFGDFGSTSTKRFRHSGTDLQMSANDGTNWYTVAADVSGLTFEYYNRAGSALSSFPLSLSDREDIRRIKITLNFTRLSQTAKVQTSVFLRSFLNEVMSVYP
jgi:prepilin-type N-terminal cleavage/methylation domain-containing protein